MDVFGALADPVRRSLLVELAAEPRRVVDLADGRPISRPAVSKHLRLLLEAGAVLVTDRGRERFYALEPAGLAPVQEYIGGLLASGLSVPIPHATLDALETEVRRTSREHHRATRDTRSSRNEDREESA